MSEIEKEAISAALMRAWQEGDQAARGRVWELLWARIYTVAIRYCARVGNASYAEDAAVQGFLSALSELDPGGGGVPFEWRGEANFVAFVRNRVLLRCRDTLRAEWRWINHLVDVSDEAGEGDGDLGWLGSTSATQEDLVRGELLKRLVQDLAAWQEICRERQALADVVVATQDYVRECLIEAGRQMSERTQDGRTWSVLTVDELAEVVEPERVEMTRSALYTFIRNRLALERNAVYLRMREIRRLITETS